ncbi:MAG: COX15/CtaA family protein [Rhodoferax sp.]|nr:COX15/CtaA family protein [Rhodoferax sp.]
MAAPPLYDLSPLAQLLLAGILAALGPLVWVWLRNRQSSTARWLQALTLLTLFLTFDLVLFGAFTRLTDSGLGCPDWPGCYGNASPVGATAAIAAAQSAMPTGPVTHGKAWVEMIHRYLATGVGVLILTLTVTGWVQRRRAIRAGQSVASRTINPWWPTVTLLWVCLQGAFGALTVTMKLFPAIVTLHLLGGMVLLALLCAQAVRATQALEGGVAAPLPTSTRLLLGLTCALTACQIALGGWVSTNYAVLACTQFPMCQNSWWPTMNFHQGFQIWRALGLTPDGGHIDFSALTAIHFTHRLFSYAVFLALGLLAWRLRRTALRPQARWIAALALCQFATGLSNVVLGWPLVAAVSHTGGAAALVAVLTWSWFASHSASRPVADAATNLATAPQRSPSTRLSA